MTSSTPLTSSLGEANAEPCPLTCAETLPVNVDGLALTLDKTTVKPTKKPSTPANISNVLRLFRLHQQGLLEEGWIKAHLSSAEHVQLWALLWDQHPQLAEWAEHKIRYDFDPRAKVLTIRISTRVHERFLASVDKRILSELDGIANSLPATLASAVQEIGWDRSSRFTTGTDKDRAILEQVCNEPDSQYGHDKARFPSVIIEVSYSQKRKDLPHLADTYILKSGGSVSVVVGLDVGYKAGKEATLSVWRPKFWTDEAGELHLAVETTISNQLYRDKDGAGTPGQLDLKLKDFAPASLLNGLPTDIQNRPITITHKYLTEHLTKAEELYDMVQGDKGCVGEHYGKKMIVHERPSSPHEEFNSDDDAEIRERQRKRARRRSEDDEDYTE
ncbi:MAG: hypothetical protein M1839_006327 [Geoglossum umbratile]|nr:MAG: hypothetical protein M1839_006327 [Geoglossum umbratile]